MFVLLPLLCWAEAGGVVLCFLPPSGWVMIGVMLFLAAATVVFALAVVEGVGRGKTGGAT